MPQYYYRAMNPHGQIQTGWLQAENNNHLAEQLQSIGLTFINSSDRGGWRNNQPVLKKLLSFTTPATIPKLPRRVLLDFYFHLHQLTLAGVPLMDSLDELRSQEQDLKLVALLNALTISIKGGKSLNQAMASFPQVFDQISVQLVATGEQSGKLDEALAGIIEDMKWRDEILALTWQITTYPLFMLLVLFGLTAFMIYYLVPRLANFLISLQQELPLATQLLLYLAELFRQPWMIVLPLLLVGTFITVRLTARGREFLHDHLLRLPFIGTVLHKIILARLAHAMALMYSAGIPILQILSACEKLAGHNNTRKALQQIREAVNSGESLSQAFSQAGLFPALFIRMLRVGEQTSNLDKALQHVSYFYNRDVRESVARQQSMLAPIMTLIIGALMAALMLAVLGPLYDAVARLAI